MARIRTLAELRSEVRQRADMENSQFVTDAEINRYVNESISELYDLIIENAGQEYFLVTHTFPTVPNQDTYFLPSDFYVLKGVDADLGGPEPYPLRPYMLDDRHQNQYFSRFGWGRFGNVQYRLLGQSYYDTDPTAKSGDPGLLLGTIATASAGPIVTVTLADNAPTNHFYAGQQVDFFQTSISPNTFLQTETVLGTTRGANGSWSLIISAAVPLFGPGDTIHLGNQGDYVPRIRFTPEPTGSTDVTAWYIPHAPELGADTDVWNGFNGWEEYVVVDAAIKCLEKEESDTQVLELRKQRLVMRIQSLAASCDQGFPERVTDVASNQWRWW